MSSYKNQRVTETQEAKEARVSEQIAAMRKKTKLVLGIATFQTPEGCAAGGRMSTGGLSRTPAKIAAARANLAKANAVRAEKSAAAAAFKAWMK